jgi:hypothetical protein
MLAMKIDTSDLDRKIQMLMEMPKVIEKAVVGAMAETVNDVHAAQIQGMKLSLDMPTPWLQKGLIKAMPGGKDRQFGGVRGGQTLAQAGTYFEEFSTGRSPNDVIRPHVFGGTRRKKANEYRLASVGAFTSNTQFAVMGRNYPKNMYGNIPASVYSRMVSDIGAVPTARAGKKREGKPAQFFVMKDSSGQESIVERFGNDVRTVLVFVNSVNYKVRYDYHGIGKNQANYSLPYHFNRIVNRYMNRM